MSQSHNAMVRICQLILLSLVVLMLQGCGTTHAIYSNKKGQNIMLLGYDPVAYHVDQTPDQPRAIRGSAKFQVTYEDRTYLFSSEANRLKFLYKPEQYEPAYGGFCANGAAYGMKWASNPTSFEVVNGRLYIFSGWGSHSSWVLDQASNIKAADALWQSEANQSGWRYQSIKRMISKVPHYRSNEELNAR